MGYTERNGGKPLPSLAFFHIPFPEYNEAAQDENALLIGTRKEKACAPLINTGLYAAMLNAGDIMATFVGHDHVNDYVVDWKGICCAMDGLPEGIPFITIFREEMGHGSLN